MSVILMTTLFYKALILQGEIWCWSLLGLKGLKNGIQCFGSSKQWNSVFCLSNKLRILFFLLTMEFYTLAFPNIGIQCFCFSKIGIQCFCFPNLGVLDFSFSRHWNSVFCLSQTLEFKNFAFPNIVFQCFALSKQQFWSLAFSTLEFTVLAVPNIGLTVDFVGFSKHWSSIFLPFQTLQFIVFAYTNTGI